MDCVENMPRVTILMAIYKPNIFWLIDQLKSLNAQTYKNINLLVWNDCPSDPIDYECYYKEYITNFPYEIHIGTKNLGSNGAFEELTKLAKAEYVAYCDQDDVWLPEKIEVLVNEALKIKADLLCSDMYVIDGSGKVVADSIVKVRPHQILDIKGNIFKYLLTKNFVTGCTTLVKTEMAKQSLPFPKEFVHDWWLALYISAFGSIKVVKESLIKYRIHGSNQTSILIGVKDKQSYYRQRIAVLQQRLDVLTERFGGIQQADCIHDFSNYVNYRMEYFNNPNLLNCYRLFKLRRLNKGITYFEILLPWMPNFIFGFLIKQICKGNI